MPEQNNQDKNEQEKKEREKLALEIFYDLVSMNHDVRAKHLDKICGNDAPLRKRVEVLLQSEAELDSSWGASIQRKIGQEIADAYATKIADSLIGQKIEGKYLVQNKIGSGGIGVVYRALDTSLNRPVVIKLMREDAANNGYLLSKFRQEAKTLARINHPYVVTVHAVDRLPDGQTSYIVMEYIEGSTLQKLIEGGKLELGQIATIFDQICKGLSAAHAEGVIHRDLKPNNIMLQKLSGKEELAKVIDFGIAKVDQPGEATATWQMQNPGTLPYMSPEQITLKEVSVLSDVYALGVIAYQMVTRQLPFNVNWSSLDAAFQVVYIQGAGVKKKPRELRPDLPASAEAAILKALSHRAEDRFQTVEAFRQAFVGALTSRNAVAVVKQSVLPAKQQKRSQSFWLVAVLTVVVVGMFAIVGIVATVTPIYQSPGAVSTKEPVPSTREPALDVGRFVQIPAGEFMMGSDKEGREQPVHKVVISRGFEMGKYEVTQKQWEVVRGSNPSHFKGADLPVEEVSWEEVQQFISELNNKSTKYSYRLPTEAEWEYACRAGSRGDYAGELDSMGWYDRNSGNQTHPVGQKQPNAWGLYDMHGNVWEWCSDWYGEYSSDAVTDPRGASSGSYRVVRGGGWGDPAHYCPSAFRGYDAPDIRDYNLGFRLVRTAR